MLIYFFLSLIALKLQSPWLFSVASIYCLAVEFEIINAIKMDFVGITTLFFSAFFFFLFLFSLLSLRHGGCLLAVHGCTPAATTVDDRGRRKAPSLRLW
uniref:Uncharacterized protein n=1 Tax=Rhizophora mucronata TaxID=61149 RepID=A0A2P2KDV3_RHIMU